MEKKLHKEKSSYLVLIVDDDKILRQILSLGMSKAGFFVAESHGGYEAIEDFKKLQPDVILLDVIMPDIDGFEVCTKIRQLPGGDRVPIIMITGQDDYNSINKAFECGATDFVVKPISPLLLSYRIRYILRANQAMSDLDSSQMRLATVQEIAHLSNWEWRLSDNHIKWGEDIALMFGLEPKDYPQSYDSFLELVNFDDRNQVSWVIEEALSNNSSFTFEHKLENPNKSDLVFRQDGTIITDSQDVPSKILFTCQDITKKKITEQKIKFLAYYDRLTGLPNRFLFKEHLIKAISSSQRNELSLVVVFVDIDNFRIVNDTFGREAGDKILKIISSRLKDCIRLTDTPANVSKHDITARFGADEFGIILEGLRDIADAAIVARRVIDHVTTKIQHEDNEIFLNCRVGLSVYPDDGNTVEDLMKCADSALSSVKELEKNSYQFYTADLNAKAFARFALETSLRRAVERNEFILLYQPQVDLKAGVVNAVEALVRWNHPNMGIISPMDFIPVAEDSGLIIPIGEWVTTTACKQCKEWEDAGLNIKVAINISPAQFRDKGLFEMITRVIEETEANPDLIEIEITESMLMDNIDSSIDLLDKIHQYGCRISIDDFGTGYSSLNYLKRFPVDVLKIDRSFVNDLTTSEDDALIVKAIVTLAHNLNLEVVAEGVEEKEHLTYLSYLGCDIIQGFLISKPIAVDQLDHFFNDWKIEDV